MESADDIKMNSSPIVTNLDWIENGKIRIAFKHNARYRHNITSFEMFYCYINDNDANWYHYASNHWRGIFIASKDRINKNIELRIATNPDIYDKNKNKNLELVVKLRCHLKNIDWKWHSFFTEFSNIYYAKSISIPFILNQETQIDKVFDIIFNENNSFNDKQNGKQQLSALYESYKHINGIHAVFTKLLTKYIQTYYQQKCNKLLSNKSLTLSLYLIEIEKYIKYETEELFPFINKYCNDNDQQRIIGTIVDVFFDIENNTKTKELIENTENGINHLFTKCVCNQQSQQSDQDFHRLVTYLNYLVEETQIMFEQYLCDSIKSLLPNHKLKLLDLTIFEIHDNIQDIIRNNLENKLIYKNAVHDALNNYLNEKTEINQIINIFDQLHSNDNIINMTAKQNISKLYSMYSNIPGACSKIGKLLSNHAKIYHKQNSTIWWQQNSFSEYLIKAEQCISNEEQLSSFINHQSITDLVSASRDELLKYPNYRYRIQKGISESLDKSIGDDMKITDDGKADLSRIYRLYSRFPGTNLFNAECIKRKICDLGNNYTQKSKETVSKIKNGDNSPNSGRTLIESLIDLHDKLSKIVENQFQSDQLFQKMLKEGFVKVMYQEYYTHALLARYANDILKKGTDINVTNMDNTMDQIVHLYGYLSDKDIFERDYQLYLASRLLQDLSINTESERLMIDKLKTECVEHWTSKLEVMLQDMQRSKELRTEFKQKCNDFNEYELNIAVCSYGTWQSQYDSAIYPSDILNGMEKFKEFYHNKYPDFCLSAKNRQNNNQNRLSKDELLQKVGDFVVNGRKLDFTTNYDGKIMDLFTKRYWYNVGSDVVYDERDADNSISSNRRLNFLVEKGKAELSVDFNTKTNKVLVVSTVQMMVLLCFNDKKTLTFKELQKKTGIKREELQTASLSMAHPKVKILRKAPNTKECADDHKFQINPNYSNPLEKIAVPTLKITYNKPGSGDKKMEAIYRSRRHQMDAAIVRIMKARKKLKHPDLVTEVVKQLRGRFTPKPVDIKKRIANLIELEYLRRDTNNRQLYHYNP